MSQVSKNNKGWDATQIREWSYNQSRKQSRDYSQIVERIQKLPANTNLVEEYGKTPEGHPLLCVTRNEAGLTSPTMVITGGVHGYELSGIEAAVQFLETEAPRYRDTFNFVVFPCVSPWAYEHNHRWTSNAQDPNREFKEDSLAEESSFLMQKIDDLGISFKGAIDLHETPDMDIELRQQRADRFGTPLSPDWQIIPQGFYVMVSKTGDDQNDLLQAGYAKSIIEQVRKVSPIAPEPTVIGHKNHRGYTQSPPVHGTLRHYMNERAAYMAVSEVYPDHPDMGANRAVKAQLAAIDGALNFLKSAP